MEPISTEITILKAPLHPDPTDEMRAAAHGAVEALLSVLQAEAVETFPALKEHLPKLN